jgi:hypothetical protein
MSSAVMTARSASLAASLRGPSAIDDAIFELRKKLSVVGTRCRTSVRMRAGHSLDGSG